MVKTQTSFTIDGRLLERFSGVVGQIYDAALNPGKWPSVVKSIAELHDSPKALLLTPSTAPDNGGFVFPYGISESVMQLWATKYHPYDCWMRAGIEKGLIQDGNVLSNEDLFLSLSELEESIFYREFLTRQDIYQIVAGVVFDGLSSDTLPTSCSIFNSRAAPAFTEINKKPV